MLLLPLVVTMAAHTIVFGHSRYHLPIMPLFALYAAALATRVQREHRIAFTPAAVGAVVSIAVLAAIWVRQVAVVDLGRLTGLMKAG